MWSMLRQDLPGFALAVIAAYAVGIGFWFVFRAATRPRWAAVVIAIVLLSSVPLFVPFTSVRLRALVAFLSTDVLCKLVDAARRVREYQSPAATFADWLRFLVPFPVLLVTGEERQAARQLTTPLPVAAVRAGIGLVLFLLCWVVLFTLHPNPVLKSSFALDHVVKMTLFVGTLEVISLLALGLDRLAGFETRPLMNRIWAARTPAEFWLRYNTRIHAWLTRNLFIPIGGFRRPVMGVVVVFFVSALLHEVAFDLALSRVDGSQFLFFLLQIPAVLLSPALERFAKSGGRLTRVMAHIATIAWLVLTAVLFFRGVGQIFPFFYSAEMPPPLFGEWSFAPAR